MKYAASQRGTDISRIVCQIVMLVLAPENPNAVGLINTLYHQLADLTDEDTANAIIGGIMAGLA